MRILRRDERPEPALGDRILAWFGRDPEVAAARELLRRGAPEATHQLRQAAEAVFENATVDPGARARSLARCRVLVLAADDPRVSLEVHRELFEVFVLLHVPRLAELCADLLARLLDERRAEYAAVLDRFLLSPLDVERAFAAATLMRVRRLTQDDARRFLRSLRDQGPRVAPAAVGGLYRLWLRAPSGPALLEEALQTLDPELLAPAALPDPSPDGWAAVPPWMQLWPGWYGFARTVRAGLARRVAAAPGDERARLVALTRMVRARTFRVFAVQSAATAAFLVTARLLWLAAAGADARLLPGEAVALHALLLLGLPFLAVLLGVQLARTFGPMLRYGSLHPRERMLERLAAGEADDRLVLDVARTAARDDGAQAALLAGALRGLAGARKVLLVLLQRAPVRPELAERARREAGGDRAASERLVTLLAELSALPLGRLLVHGYLSAHGAALAECGNLGVLLDGNAPLLPPLLKLAVARLKDAPLDDVRLLLQVVAEAPDLYETYRAPVIEGLGLLLREGVIFPEVTYHLLQLYPGDLRRALVRGWRGGRRDLETRRRLTEALDRNAIRTFLTAAEDYRFTRDPDAVLKLQVAIVERALEEAPERAHDLLLELVGLGLPDELFARLPAAVRSEEAARAARALAALLRAGDAEACGTSLAAAAAALEGQECGELGEVVAAWRAAAEAATPEDWAETLPRLARAACGGGAAAAGLRPAAPALEALADALDAALAAPPGAPRAAWLLLARRHWLDLRDLARRRVRPPHRALVGAVLGRLGARLDLELGLPPPTPDRTEPEASEAARSVPAGRPGGFLGEATLLLRGFLTIVAPTAPPPPGAPPAAAPGDELRALGRALELLERADWVDATGLWPTWTVPPQDRGRAAAEAAPLLARCLASGDAPLRAAGALAAASTTSATARRLLLPPLARALAADAGLLAGLVAALPDDDPEEPLAPLVLEAVHLAALEAPDGDEAGLAAALEAADRVGPPERLMPGSVRFLGRAALRDERALSVLETLEGGAEPLRALPAKLAQARLGAPDAWRAVATLVLDRGAPFSTGPLFPAALLFAPPRSLRTYREWLVALFDATREAGALAEAGREDARSFLDELLRSDHPKAGFAAAVELARLALARAGAAGLEPLLAAPPVSREPELSSHLLAALLRLAPEAAWEAIEELAGDGKVTIDAVLDCLKETTPSGLEGPLRFLDRYRDRLLRRDGAALLQQAHQLGTDHPLAWSLLRSLTEAAPALLLHPTQEPLWLNLAAVSRVEAARALDRAAAGGRVPARHLAPLLRHVVGAAPGDADRLVDLARRLRGDALAPLGDVASTSPEAARLLTEAVEDRAARPEDRRGALAGLARACPRHEPARRLALRLLHEARLPRLEQEQLGRELLGALPEAPGVVYDLLATGGLLGDRGAADLALALAAAGEPGRRTTLLLERWDDALPARLRAAPPEAATAGLAHALALLARARPDEGSRARGRAEDAFRRLERLEAARGAPAPPEEAAARSELLDLAGQAAGAGYPLASAPVRGGLRAVPGLGPLSTGLDVLARLCAAASADVRPDVRATLLNVAERLAQDLEGHVLPGLPAPAARPAGQAVALLGERLAALERRPLPGAPVGLFLLGAWPVDGATVCVLSLAPTGGTPLRAAVLTVEARGAPPVDVPLGALRDDAPRVVRCRLERPAVPDERLELEVRLVGHPLPGLALATEAALSVAVAAEAALPPGDAPPWPPAALAGLGAAARRTLALAATLAREGRRVTAERLAARSRARGEPCAPSDLEALLAAGLLVAGEDGALRLPSPEAEEALAAEEPPPAAPEGPPRRRRILTPFRVPSRAP